MSSRRVTHLCLVEEQPVDNIIEHVTPSSIYSRFCSNSETDASELLENVESVVSLLATWIIEYVVKIIDTGRYLCIADIFLINKSINTSVWLELLRSISSSDEIINILIFSHTVKKYFKLVGNDQNQGKLMIATLVISVEPSVFCRMWSRTRVANISYFHDGVAFLTINLLYYIIIAINLIILILIIVLQKMKRFFTPMIPALLIVST